MRREHRWIGLWILVLVLAAAGVLGSSAEVSAAGKQKLESALDAVIKKKTNKKDSDQKKLKSLFQFCRKKYKYKRVYSISSDQKKKNWKKDAELFRSYALYMLKQKQGTCYHDAAAYAYLAKRATKLPVYIVVGETTAFTGRKQAHAWVEVKLGKKWYICDTSVDRQKKANSFFLLKKTKKVKKKYYNKYKKATRMAVKT